MATKKKRRTNYLLESGDSVIARSERSRATKQPPLNLIPDRVIVVCFYGLVAALPLFFIYPTFDIFELAKLTLLRLLTLTLIGAWAAKCYQERCISVARTPLDIFIVIYLVVYILATAFSQNPVLSLLGEYGRFEGLLTIINYTAVFCLAGSLIRNNSAAPDTRAFIRNLAFTAIGAADVISIYGVLQRFGIDFFTWSNAGTDLTRAFSTMGNPIYIAAYLTVILSVAICLFLAETAPKTRALLGFSIVLMILTLVFTFSRAGWAGFLFSLIILISLSLITNNKYSSIEPRRISRGESRSTSDKKSRLTATLTLIAVVAVVVVLAVALSASYGSAPTKSTISRALSAFNLKSAGAVERISLWKSSVEMIKDRSFLGWGPDTFGTYFTRYRRQDLIDFEYNVTKLTAPRYQNRPHSDILQQGVSAGLLGLTAYLTLILAYFIFALRRLSAHGSRLTATDKALLIGIIAGLAGYFLQIQFSFSTIAVTPQVWLLMALTFVVGNEAKGEELWAKSREQETNNKKILRVSQNKNLVRVSAANRELNLTSLPHPLLVIIVIFVISVISIGAFLSIRQLLADYYFDQGVSSIETYDSYLAEVSFDRALSLNPYEAEYANFAASSFTNAAKSSSKTQKVGSYLLTAIDYEDKAIQLNSDMPSYRYNLGNALYYYASMPGLSTKESARRYNAAAREFEDCYHVGSEER